MHIWDNLYQKRTRIGLSSCLVFWLLLWGGCQEPQKYPQLEQGVKVVRFLSAKNQLERSSFRLVFPKGRPSDFVKWMFSTLGKAEWPPTEGSVELEPGMKQALAVTRTPILPQDLKLEPDQPEFKPEIVRQIVVSGDDSRWVIEVRGFLNSGKRPVLVREWPFPGEPPSQNELEF